MEIRKPMRLTKLLGAVAAIAMSSPAGAQSVESRTFLINGLASAVPFIGYGFANLKKKIPGSELYSYISPVEGAAVIQPKIMNDIRAAWRRNPGVEINLIGISFGANLITRMAGQLHKEGIQVSYLGVIDGLPLASVTPNVRRVDNFICNFPGCLRDRVRLTSDNKSTIQHDFAYNTSHIDLGNNEEVHTRILHQIQTYSMNVSTAGLDMTKTAAVSN
jgi:hypothetical protein